MNIRFGMESIIDGTINAYLMCFDLSNDLVFATKQEINLSMAHAAAFAMRMTQLNNLMKGGDVPNPLGFFDSLRLMEKFRVPTLPGLDFFYKHDFGNDLFGLFDMLLFTLKQDITNMTKNELELKKPSDMFQLNYLIRYPYVLPQPLKPISWPGDGKGPMQTSFLITRCDFGMLRNSLIITFSRNCLLHIGFQNLWIYYWRYSKCYKYNHIKVNRIEYMFKENNFRHFKKKRKCQKMKKLIFLMTDFDEKEDTNVRRVLDLPFYSTSSRIMEKRTQKHL